MANSIDNHDKYDQYENQELACSFKSRTLKSLTFVNPGPSTYLEVSGKRKPKSRNQYEVVEKPLYDDKGHLISTGQDICDCLRNNCPGCHFACRQCKSTKCGNKCRVNRTWYYNKVEIEGIANTLEMHLN